MRIAVRRRSDWLSLWTESKHRRARGIISGAGRLVRLTIGVLFGMIGFAMAILAVAIAIRVFAAIVGGAILGEAMAMLALCLMVAVPAVLWIDLAFLLTGARNPPLSIYGMIVAGLAALVGIFFVSANLWPDLGNSFVLGVGLLIIVSAGIDVVVRQRNPAPE